MIITLTKADFSSCKIGTLTTFNVRKSTTIGATVNIIKTSVERAGYSSATTIATIVLDEANYEGHAIKVMMGSTDVSSWYSVGKVIVPAKTPITSNITISVSATAISTGGDIVEPEPEEPGTGGDSGSVIYPEGIDVPKMMPQADGYKTSTNGHIMEYSGYNWEEYDVYVSCRFGTTTAMYAACVWDKNDNYLGGIWQSTGTATIFTEELIEESDLPSGVTWSEVGKIGLSWSEGKNTPAMKLVKK